MNGWSFWYNIYSITGMTLQQLMYLSDEDREDVLVNKAVLIGSIPDDEGLYTLFQIDGFYLEVLRNGDKVTVSSTSYFEETDFLDPYLESINIDAVYEILNHSKT